VRHGSDRACHVQLANKCQFLGTSSLSASRHTSARQVPKSRTLTPSTRPKDLSKPAVVASRTFSQVTTFSATSRTQTTAKLIALGSEAAQAATSNRSKTSQRRNAHTTATQTQNARTTRTAKANANFTSSMNAKLQTRTTQTQLFSKTLAKLSARTALQRSTNRRCLQMLVLSKSRAGETNSTLTLLSANVFASHVKEGLFRTRKLTVNLRATFQPTATGGSNWFHTATTTRA